MRSNEQARWLGDFDSTATVSCWGATVLDPCGRQGSNQMPLPTLQPPMVPTTRLGEDPGKPEHKLHGVVKPQHGQESGTPVGGSCHLPVPFNVPVMWI